MKYLNRLLAAALLVAWLCSAAQWTVAANDVDESGALQISALIEQLDDDSFAVRQAASSRLGELGVAVFDVLTDAAQRASREASTRAIDILAGHLQNDDPEIRLEARRALHRVAAGENATAMRLAEQALAPAAPPPAAQPQVVLAPQPIAGAWSPFQPPFPRRLPPPLPAAWAGGRFQRVVAHNVNGVKEINVEENDRSIKIVEHPEAGITVEVTDNQGDQPRTKSYSGNSAEELKEKSPEAFRLYQQFAQDAAENPAPPMAPAMPRFDGVDPFDRMQQHLDGMIERYRLRVEQGGPQAEHFRRAIEHLQQHKARIQQHRPQFQAEPNERSA